MRNKTDIFCLFETGINEKDINLRENYDTTNENWDYQVY